jgi:hypothetical protein
MKPRMEIVAAPDADRGNEIFRGENPHRCRPPAFGRSVAV